MIISHRRLRGTTTGGAAPPTAPGEARTLPFSPASRGYTTPPSFPKKPFAPPETAPTGDTMRLTRLISGLVAAAGTMLALSSSAPALAQTQLKMNISISQNSHYGVAVDAFAREIEKRTDGRYKVQNFYS